MLGPVRDSLPNVQKLQTEFIQFFKTDQNFDLELLDCAEVHLLEATWKKNDNDRDKLNEQHLWKHYHNLLVLWNLR